MFRFFATLLVVLVAVGVCQGQVVIQSYRGGTFFPAANVTFMGTGWYDACSTTMPLASNSLSWNSQPTLPAFPVELTITYGDSTRFPTDNVNTPFQTYSLNATAGDSIEITIAGAMDLNANPVRFQPISGGLSFDLDDAIGTELPQTQFTLGMFTGISFTSTLFNGRFQLTIEGNVWNIRDLDTVPSIVVAAGFFDVCCQQGSPYVATSMCQACPARGCEVSCPDSECP